MAGKRADRPLKDGRVAIYRHPWPVRLTHWAWALSLLLLLLSGLQVLNAHPALYWGEDSRFAAPFAAIRATEGEAGAQGWLQIGGLALETTGVLGVSPGEDGAPEVRAFPRWATLPAYPDLGAGRQWHVFAAWGLMLSACAYLAYNALGGRFRRELLPSAADLAGLGRSIRDHLRLARHPAARGYNVLQKIAYLLVMVVIIPLMAVSGLAMSPAMDAWAPLLSDVFGGRQSARSAHFLGASALVIFILVHLLMVLAAGPLNEMRSILTGWFVVGRKGEGT